jgi:hypothetical protein
VSPGHELLVDSRRPVSVLMGLLMNCPNFPGQRLATLGLSTGLMPPPSVEPGSRDSERHARHDSRPLLLMFLNEGIPHRDSLAKKAVAFFEISRSIRRHSFSARSQRTSASSPDA